MELDLPAHGDVTPLPLYRAVLAVDMENFSSTSARNQQIIGALIPKVLEEALKESGMAKVWEERLFARHGGDGYVFGTDPEHLPFLISPFLGNLQNSLEHIQPVLAALDRDLRMRLRVSIDVGPLPHHGPGDPKNAMGEAMISTHRLLDSEPVRAELKRTDPDTTLVAAIISRRVYEDVVLGDFTTVRPTRWRQVNATVGGKGFSAEGYLFVPTPSWGPDPEGDTTPKDAPDGGAPTGDSSGATTNDAPSRTRSTPEQVDAYVEYAVRNNNRGQVVQGGTINGGVHHGGERR